MPNKIIKITSIGFWLPMGRINFFHPEDVKKFGNEDSYDESKLNKFDRNKRPLLNASVFERVLSFSTHYKYSECYVYYPEFRKEINAIFHDSDPNSIVLVSNEPKLTFTISENEKIIIVNKIILNINDRGYYHWLFIHDEISIDSNSYKNLIDRLKEYILSMIGDINLYKSTPAKSPFFNKDENSSNVINKESLIEVYNTQHGILTYFQLNLILEGISNSLYNPELFFIKNRTDLSAKRHIEIEKKYSLKYFVKEILTFSYLGDLQDKLYSILSNQDDLIKNERNLYKQLFIEQPHSIYKTFTGEIKKRKRINSIKFEQETVFSNISFPTKLHSILYRDAIRQFLRKVGFLYLQKLKWNLENCRRELLPFIITFTHYQQQLVQLPSDNEFSDAFKGINESQLSGYVKLVSGKLPLIYNVLIFINLEKGNLLNSGIFISKYFEEFDLRIKTIEKNVIALEKALDRVVSDRALSEQSKIRHEQETQAEIARRRQRLGIKADGTEDKSRKYLTIIGVLGAISGILYLLTQDPEFNLSWILNVWTYSLVTLIILILRIRYYVIAKYSLHNHFYHELDLTLEIPIQTNKAALLFEKGYVERLKDMEMNKLFVPLNLVTDSKSEKLITVNDEKYGYEVKKYLKTNWDKFPEFNDIKKVSYRYSHGHFDEGVHKIHYEFDIKWPSKKRKRNTSFLDSVEELTWKLGITPNPTKMKRCEIVYEILSHSPSNNVEHMVQELRFVATYYHKLMPEQVMLLKLKLLNTFITTWISEENISIAPEILKNVTPLFSLTIASLKTK